MSGADHSFSQATATPAPCQHNVVDRDTPWIYDSNLPNALAEELNAEGIGRPSSPCIRANFEEKQKAMEMHSLSASGDLVSEKEHGWTRISAAARASQLRTRMRKSQAKSKRSASACLGEDARSELGLSDYRACSSLDKAGEAKDRETSRRFSYPATRYPSLEDKTVVSEPIIINTVDDLLRHLEKIGRLPPTVSSVPDASPAPSVTGSETEVESGDSSFESEKAQIMMRYVLATCETRRLSFVLISTSL
ncbi:hypothetical protein ACEPAI_8256 [Sanghuangporus weigelae]